MNTPTQNTPLHPLLDLAEFTDRAIIRTIPFPVGTPHHQHLLETNSCRLYYTEHGILTFHAITPSILEEHKGGCYSERLIIATARKGFTTYLAYDPLWTATEEKIRTHLKTTTPARPSGSKNNLRTWPRGPLPHRTHFALRLSPHPGTNLFPSEELGSPLKN